MFIAEILTDQVKHFFLTRHNNIDQEIYYNFRAHILRVFKHYYDKRGRNSKIKNTENGFNIMHHATHINGSLPSSSSPAPLDLNNGWQQNAPSPTHEEEQLIV